MEIDATDDWQSEPLTLIYDKKKGLSETVSLDVFKLNDDLTAVYADNVGTLDGQTGVMLRAVLVAAGYKNIPEGAYLPHALAQRIAHGIRERKKKFDSTLWGTGGEWPVLGGSTVGSTPQASPTVS